MMSRLRRSGARSSYWLYGMVVALVCAMLVGGAAQGAYQKKPQKPGDRGLSSFLEEARKKLAAMPPGLVPDVKRTFDQVREKDAGSFFLSNKNLLGQMPAGYNESSGLLPHFHQQGIQRLPGGGYVVSGSTKSSSASYFYVADVGGNVVNVTHIEQGRYSHAGGIQVCGNILAVGVEQPGNRTGGSKVCFYDLTNPNLPSRLPLTIPRDPYTAGAVGLTRFGSNYLCVVGDYNSERLDFYQFGTDRVRREFGTAQGITVIGRRVAGGDWKAYQNLNLFVDAQQTPWIVAMHTDLVPFMKDWADLWRVTFDGRGGFQLKKEGKKHHVRSGDGPRFIFGSGYTYVPTLGRFQVYSIEALMSSSGITRAAAWNL